MRYLLKKLSFFLFSLFLIISLTFLLMKSVPGDPFQEEQALPQEILTSLHAHYGLDQPWHIQYIKFLKGIITFDLGPSYKYEGRNVSAIISESFPISFSLGSIAFVMALIFGVLLGSLSAFSNGKTLEKICTVIVALTLSIPSFLQATFLQYFFAIKLHLFPIARLESFAHMILPSIALAALPSAYIAKLIKENILNTLSQDYIELARIKGLSEFQIFFRHILKNSLIPILGYLAPLSASIFTGSFIIEKIFGIPGLGGWFVKSIANRDYTMIMGITVFYSFVLLLVSFIADALFFLLDPRLKKEGQ